MIRENKNSAKIKLAIFIFIYAGLAAFSLVWYDTLKNMNCDLTQPIPENQVKTGSSQDVAQDCSEQLHFHWIKFYGINGMLYGASLIVFVVNMRKSRKN